MKKSVISEQKKINPLVLPGISHQNDVATVKNNDYSLDNLLYPELKKIAVTVSDYFRIETWRMKIKIQKQEIVKPRQISMYFAKKYTKYSLARIGEYFGGKDHATVLHAYKTINNLYDTDKNFQHDIDILNKQISKQFSVDFDNPIYTLNVDHENRKVQVRTNIYFDFAAFRRMSQELEKTGIKDNYKIEIL